MPAAATTALTGLIPVTVAGGIALKFTKAMFPAHSGRMGTSRRRSRSRRRTRRSSNYPYGSSPF